MRGTPDPADAQRQPLPLDLDVNPLRTSPRIYEKYAYSPYK
jgi:hypothetical protein